jgi:predicted RecA/RadA family phage recombinase
VPEREQLGGVISGRVLLVGNVIAVAVESRAPV